MINAYDSCPACGTILRSQVYGMGDRECLNQWHRERGSARRLPPRHSNPLGRIGSIFAGAAGGWVGLLLAHGAPTWRGVALLVVLGVVFMASATVQEADR